MTLSKNKREQLLEFIKSRYVDYHDIRLLIARDLEDDITKQMKENETLSFEDALEQAYKKYGVIGFSDVSEKYMKKIQKHYYKVILRTIKAELSTLRFWLFTMISFLTLYGLFMLLDIKPFIFAGGFTVLLISGAIFYFQKIYKKLKELKKRNSYYYLDELLLSHNSILFPLTYVPLAIATNLRWLTENEDLSMAILAIFTTISLTAIDLLFFRLYNKRSLIIENYREDYLAENINFKLERV